MSSNEAWARFLTESRERWYGELLEFLRIPSISALPAHAGDVGRAAKWTADRLTTAGMEHVEIMPTGGHPVVYADWLHAVGKPTVLIYGHFDVQPVDPVSLWTTPPFEPTLREGKLYARGASDDKGNMLVPILAVEALLRATGSLPLNVKFFFEGQEEIGSPQLPAFVASNRVKLAADHVLSADGGQWSEKEPELTVGLRGLCSLEIHVTGPSSDLHSGLYGGAVANPLHALAEIVTGLHAPDGRVAVAGFYDGVRELSTAERADIARVPFDEAKWKGEIGISELWGEPGYTTHERIWVRPTLEVNGLYGGFQGEGTKTVLPSEGHVKITCRLVPDQDPAAVLSALETHIGTHTPRGVRVQTRRGASLARPFGIRPDHPGNLLAARVLKELYGREPYQVRSGGTVPVCELFLRELGRHTVSFGFGLPDERFHAPNEFFRVSSFELGQRAYCRILTELGSARAGG